MKFAKWVFQIAGIYGLVLMSVMYFLAEQIGKTQPPPLNHLEFYYGFIGVTLAWQIVFLIIASGPAKYRALMLAALVEKGSYVLAILVLTSRHLVSRQIQAGALIDAILGGLFAAAYFKTAVTSKQSIRQVSA